MKNMIQKKNLLTVGLILFLGVMLFLAACSDSPSNGDTNVNTNENESTDNANGGSVNGGKIKIAFTEGLHAFAPSSEIRTQIDAILSGTALEKLGRYEGNGEMEPLLAKSWDKNPDELSITFELNEGIKFHDGTDFNAEVAKWNIEEFMDSGRTELDNITSIESTEEYSLTVYLGEWDSSMANNIMHFVPMISKVAYEENGKDWIMENPVGTGPYKFESWSKDENVIFTKNEDYWQEGKPHLDSIEFLVYADSSTIAASLQAGEIDVYILASSLIANDMSDSEKFYIIQNETGLGGMAGGVIGDSANPDSPFSNKLVRRAVSMAIDREAIIETLFYGYGVATNQWGAPGSPTFNDNLSIEYDPEKAKELLSEAGYPDGFKTVYNTTNITDEVQRATAIQEYLSKVGIEAELNVMDDGLFRTYTLAAEDQPWEGLIGLAGRGDYDLTTYMPRNFSPDGVIYSHNITHEEDILNLFEELKGESDSQVIQDKSYELQRLVAEEHALATFLYITSNLVILKNEINDTGFDHGHAGEWTPEEVYLE